jgi:hypothetical protein
VADQHRGALTTARRVSRGASAFAAATSGTASAPHAEVCVLAAPAALALAVAADERRSPNA